MTADELQEQEWDKEFEAAARRPLRERFKYAFNYAQERKIVVEDFPVCHPDDIIASKRAANRKKDRE